MHQIKIFSTTEDRVDALEKDVNAWLKSSSAKVVNVFGNIAPQSVLPQESSKTLLGAAEGTARRFAPSDLFLVIVYEA